MGDEISLSVSDDAASASVSVEDASLSSGNDLITASIEDPEAFLDADSVIVNPYEGEYTYTPTEEAQTIPVEYRTPTGDITIAPIPSNYIDTTVEHPAAAEDIAYGKQAYADGVLITGSGYMWNPWGPGAEIVRTYDMGTTALKDTDFNTWAPTTTATVIQATSNLGTITSPALDVYEYVIKTVFESNTAYASGTSLKAAVVRQLFEIVQVVHRKPSNFTNMASSTDNYNYCATLYTAPFMDYYNTSGTHTMTWTGSYGIYPAATAATFSSTSSLNPTITIKAPTYNARCYKSYFSTTIAAAVDKNASNIKCKVYVYRVRNSTLKAMYDEIVDVYNN